MQVFVCIALVEDWRYGPFTFLQKCSIVAKLQPLFFQVDNPSVFSKEKRQISSNISIGD